MSNQGLISLGGDLVLNTGDKNPFIAHQDNRSTSHGIVHFEKDSYDGIIDTLPHKITWDSIKNGLELSTLSLNSSPWATSQ